MAKDPGRRRILCLGDSFVEGWGVTQEERVSEQLQRSWPEGEVLNLGVAGYGTDQEWLLYEKLGRRLAPDLVILFFYGNDLWNNAARQGIGAERGYKPFFQLGADGRLQLSGVPVRKAAFWDPDALPLTRRIGSVLEQHLHLWALLRKGLAPEVPAGQQERYYQGLYGADPATGGAEWELSGRLLDAFGQSVVASGARMLLVYVPALVQIEEKDWKMKRELHGLAGDYDLEKPQRQLRDLALRYGLDFLDLDTAFAAAAGEHTLYFRDSHWNAAGHQLAARTIAARLAESQGMGTEDRR